MNSEVRYQTVWRGTRSDYPRTVYRWKWLAHLVILIPNLVLGRGLHGDWTYYVREVVPVRNAT